MKRNGQVFIVSAVIFSSLILITAFSYQQITFNDQRSDTQFYFSSALEKQAEIFNAELKENYSEENIKKGFYSFNSFIDSQAERKSIEYSAFQLLILPEKNSTLIVNYRAAETEFNYSSGSWHNQTILPYQNTVIEGENNLRKLEVEELDISESFNTSKPTLVGYMKMKSESETWRNYILR
jgi:hypothetical protein